MIDVEKRNVNSRLSKVRDVSFSNIQIRTRGLVLVAGMPSSPLEGISFWNVAMRVEGFEEIERASKLRGGSAVFLGLNGVARNETALTGNDPCYATHELEGGATYVQNR